MAGLVDLLDQVGAAARGGDLPAALQVLRRTRLRVPAESGAAAGGPVSGPGGAGSGRRAGRAAAGGSGGAARCWRPGPLGGHTL